MSLLQFFGLSPGPTDDFWYNPTGQKTVAGVAVDESVAMTYSACWACTRVLSTGGAMAPLELLRELDGGGSEPASDTRRYGMVYDQINPHMSNFMFRSSMMANQVNWGNAFGEIEYSGGGQATWIHPIHPSRIPQRNVRRNDDGSVYYLINNNDGTTTPLEAWEMLHVPSPASDDGIYGKGVVTQARLSIGFGIATETQGAAYMGNSARPTVVIEGGKFKDNADREEYRRQWEEIHGGPINNARPAFLPAESKLHALNWSAEDSQFLTTRQHNVEEVARWYGVPPHMIGHLLRSTYNNIEHQSIEFVRWGLRPWLVAWEQELNRKLLSVEERKTLYFCHDLDDLERGDLQSRTAAYKEQFFNGKISLDEWRAKDNERPIGHPAGKVHFVQQAMIPVDLAAEGPAQPEPTAQRDSGLELAEAIQKIYLGVGRVISSDEARAILNKTYAAGLKLPGPPDLGPSVPTPEPGGEPGQPPALDEPKDDSKEIRETQKKLAAAILGDVMSRMVSLEINAVKRVSEKASKFDCRVKEFYDRHSVTLARNLTAPLSAALSAIGDERSVVEVLGTIVSAHIAESMNQLNSLTDCTADQLEHRVTECVENWYDRLSTDLIYKEQNNAN